jgi:hypothetical protein
LSSFGKLHYRLSNSLGSNDYQSGGGVRSGFDLNAGTHISLTPGVEIDVWAGYAFMSLGSVYGPGDFRTLGINSAVVFAIF